MEAEEDVVLVPVEGAVVIPHQPETHAGGEMGEALSHLRTCLFHMDLFRCINFDGLF